MTGLDGLHGRDESRSMIERDELLDTRGHASSCSRVLLPGLRSAALAAARPGGGRAAPPGPRPRTSRRSPAVQADSRRRQLRRRHPPGVPEHAVRATPTAVADALSDLGVRHVRDDLFMNNPRQYAGIKTVADRGIKFNLIMGRPDQPGQRRGLRRHRGHPAARPASVESVEGINEWDLFSGGAPTWARSWRPRQQELYAGGQGQPGDRRTCRCSSPALAFKWNYADRRRHVAVRRHRQRAHVPRRLQALQRDQPDHHGDPRLDPRPSRWSRPRPATTTP